MQQPTADGQKKVEALRFGGLELIRDSAIRMVKVESEVDRGKRLGLSSGGHGWNFHPQPRLRGAGQRTGALAVQGQRPIPADDVAQLCVCKDGTEGPILALYFEIAQGDGSGRPDGVSPGVAHVDGSGYAALGKPVARVLDKDVSEDGKTLGLLVEDRGRLMYRQFSLETFAPLSEQLVAQLQRK